MMIPDAIKRHSRRFALVAWPILILALAPPTAAQSSYHGRGKDKPSNGNQERLRNDHRGQVDNPNHGQVEISHHGEFYRRDSEQDHGRDSGQFQRREVGEFHGRDYGQFDRGNHERVRVVFVPEHRKEIREYFIVHQADLPRYYYSDLDEFPPGIQRQIIVGRRLPPGLARWMYPFPSGLDAYLGPPPPYCERVIIGRNAYLIDRRTNFVLDMLSNLIYYR